MGQLRRKRCLLAMAGCLALVALPCPGWGQGLGPEFQINTLTTNYQYAPSVASDAMGNFLVVWNSAFGGSFVYGRRFDSTGIALGDELELNDSTLGIEISRSVAVDGSGDILGVWEGYDVFQEEERFLSGRAFESDGVPRGSAFPIDSFNSDIHLPRAQVSAFAEDQFVVAWQDYDGYELRIVGRTFDEAGISTSGEFAVSQNPEDSNRYPDVAGSGDEFVVVWTKLGSPATRVFGRRFGAGGVPIGDEFQVSATSAGDQLHSSVAASPTGGFVITWLALSSEDPSWGVFSRRFDATGEPIGAEFHVNTFTTGYQFEPAVAVDASGDFVVVWHSELQDGSGSGVFGQHFDSTGAKLGGEFQVNTYTTGSQGYPQVVALGSSTFVAVWNSEGQDGSYTGIFGRRLRIRVFSDGFELGDACAWSAVTGGGTCP